jgi:hypothetical protein
MMHPQSHLQGSSCQLVERGKVQKPATAEMVVQQEKLSVGSYRLVMLTLRPSLVFCLEYLVAWSFGPLMALCSV